MVSVMSLFALVLFGYGSALVYHLVPRKARWVVLLAASLAFYVSRNLMGLPFLLATALISWFASLQMDRAASAVKEQIAASPALGRDEKKALRAGAKTRQRRWLLFALLADFAMLAVFKYTNDILGLVGASPLGLLLPLGISFYTFQSTGYLIDVYNGKTPAEKNTLRFLLFVSFFPQILQGPIGRYDELNPQLAEAHDFDIDQLDRATLLILYGLFKKMIIADRVLPLVNAAFAGPQGGAVALVGVLAYSLQQYCDFSGGIDLVSGIAELYGIRLAPNFRQPYFSVSLADFWRRWHISLGAWMRDYVFYPFALTSPMQKLGKASKARFGKAFARAVPAAVGNLLVFFLVGLWHGATPNYIVWGLYNGLILAVSALLEPVYKGWNERHASLSASRGFHLFRILRTFLVVNIGWFFDRCARLGDAFAMMGSVLTQFRADAVTEEFWTACQLPAPDRMLLLVSVVILFVVSLLKERGVDVRTRTASLVLPLRWAVMLFAICAVLIFGVWGSGFDEAAFIYNGF